MGGFDWVFSLARVVATSLKGTKKVLVANVEGIEGETSNEQIAYGALGVITRPLPPDENGAAEAICVRTEDGLLPVGWRDPRLSAQTNGKLGEAILTGYYGGFVSLKPNATNDGCDFTAYAPKADGSKASAISIDTTTANSNVTIMHDSGVMIQLAGSKVVIANRLGNAYIEINDTGIVINGNVQVNGSMVVGDIATALSVMLPANTPSSTLKASAGPPV
jgi:hypothetical protein